MVSVVVKYTTSVQLHSNAYHAYTGSLKGFLVSLYFLGFKGDWHHLRATLHRLEVLRVLEEMFGGMKVASCFVVVFASLRLFVGAQECLNFDSNMGATFDLKDLQR